MNARPVYLFLKSMKNPCSDAFVKAIDACRDGHFVNLEAMLNERYAAFLIKNNDEVASKDCIINAYFLYQDWGAHAKALQLSKEHEYLKSSKRKKTRSFANTVTSAPKSVSSSVSNEAEDLSPQKRISFSFNTTLKQTKMIYDKN